MKKVIITAVICSMGYLLPAQKQNSKDETFVKEAAEAGMMEVKLGELAQSKGQSQDIKTLGQHMVTDHTKANEELKALAAKKSMVLPTGLSKEGQTKYDELSKKTGQEFDKAYAKMMVDDHEKVISKFKKESEKGEDQDFKSWAAKTLTTLEHHLAMSKQAYDKVKGNGSVSKKD